MAAALAERRVRLRPHAKSHKCPEIARRQVARGAVGICCQKVSRGRGVRRCRHRRRPRHQRGRRRRSSSIGWRELARRARIGVLVDDADAGRGTRGRRPVAVGVDSTPTSRSTSAAGRCGVAPGEPAAALAREQWPRSPACGSPACTAITVGAQHLRTPAERSAAIAAAAAAARALTRGDRAPPASRSSGSPAPAPAPSSSSATPASGTRSRPDRSSSWTATMRTTRAGPQTSRSSTRCSSSATVMSRPAPSRAIVDAGLKASSVDSGLPTIWQRADLRYRAATDEHGVVELAAPGRRPRRRARRPAAARSRSLRSDGQPLRRTGLRPGAGRSSQRAGRGDLADQRPRRADLRTVRADLGTVSNVDAPAPSPSPAHRSCPRASWRHAGCGPDPALVHR